MIASPWRSVAAAMIGWLGCCLTGCSDGPTRPANLPPLVACRLQIQFHQSPVSDATITLIPDAGDWVGVGRTDAAGNAELQTLGRCSGVPAGKYVVVVTKYEPVADSPPDPTSPEEDAAMQAESRPNKRKSLIPEKYAKPETSDLQLTIADQPVNQTLKLSP